MSSYHQSDLKAEEIQQLKMLPITEEMTSLEVLAQLKLRLSFANELDQAIRKNDASRWNINFMNAQNLVNLITFISGLREYSDLVSLNDEQKTTVTTSIQQFDEEIIKARLINYYPTQGEIKTENNIISDETRHIVASSLKKEIARLQKQYGLTPENKIDTNNKIASKKKYGQKIIDVAITRITAIQQLRDRLYNDPDNLNNIYQGKNAAQPKDISKENLITELETLKKQMKSTGSNRVFGNFNRNSSFFVTGSTNIDTIINDLRGIQKTGFKETVKKIFRK
jgi:hypothetical protein